MDLGSTDAIVSWASFFANHSAVRTAVVFAHIGGLTAGGGCAIAADRSTLLVPHDDERARAAQLRSLEGVHRVVMIGLIVIVTSGVLLLASDINTFLYSKMFWSKMGLIGLLLANGAVLRRAEHRARDGAATAWPTLRTTSIVSLVLWLSVALAGVTLTNVS